MTAYGFCNWRPKWLDIKNKPTGEYVNISVEINNRHDHAHIPNQVRGQARIDLGAKIMAENGGSYEERLWDLRDNYIKIKEVTFTVEPSALVSRKCKSVFKHKGTNLWLAGKLSIGGAHL